MIGLERTLIVWATLAVVTVASGLYGTAIIGGVVGDYLGATIQVSKHELRCCCATRKFAHVHIGQCLALYCRTGGWHMRTAPELMSMVLRLQRDELA